MTSHKLIAMSLCAAIVSSVSLARGVARADSGRDDDRPIHLYATVLAPIGKIANSISWNGALTINSKPATTGQLVWSGDSLVSRGAKVFVSLDSIGQLTLSKGTAVRLATAHMTRGNGTQGSTLIASLVEGELAVRLEYPASAYVRVGGLEYVSSEGADFVATAREGRVSMIVKSGEVRAEPQSGQHQYSIRPVGHGDNIKVPAGGLTRIQVQVLEDNRPVPDVGILFALDTSAAVVGLLGLGTLSGATANVITNADGMAAVQFVARNTPGSSSISATIEGTRVSWTGQISVTSGRELRGRGWLIAAVIGAGAVAAAGIGYALTRDKGTLQAQPPVVKNP